MGAAAGASFGSSTWNTRGLCASSTQSRNRKLSHAQKIIDMSDFAAFQETHGSSVVIIDMFRRLQADKHVAWSSFESPQALTLDTQTIQLGSVQQSSGKEPSCDVNCFFEPNGSSAANDCCQGDSLDKADKASLDSDSCSSSSTTSLTSRSSSSSYSSSASSSGSTRVGGVLNILSKKAFPAGTTFSSLTIVQGRCLETIAEVGGRTSVFINVHFFDWTSNDIRAFVDRGSLHHKRALNDPLHYFSAF